MLAIVRNYSFGESEIRKVRRDFQSHSNLFRKMLELNFEFRIVNVVSKWVNKYPAIGNMKVLFRLVDTTTTLTVAISDT